MRYGPRNGLRAMKRHGISMTNSFKPSWGESSKAWPRIEPSRNLHVIWMAQRAKRVSGWLRVVSGTTVDELEVMLMKQFWRYAQNGMKQMNKMGGSPKLLKERWMPGWEAIPCMYGIRNAEVRSWKNFKFKKKRFRSERFETVFFNLEGKAPSKLINLSNFFQFWTSSRLGFYRKLLGGGGG